MGFYSGTDMIQAGNGKYIYNAYKILNKNPNYTSYVSGIKSNIDNFINVFSEQLTTRQKNIISGLKSTFEHDYGHVYDKDGIIEFRYEGAGCYRGDSDNYYTPSEVSTASVDFRNLGGYHKDNDSQDGFNDGLGLYGAMSVVYKKGDIMGVFFRASTLPDQMEFDDTVASGKYKFKVGTHPISGGYKALNLYNYNESRTLPAIIDHVSGNGITGVNSHAGYKNMRGSEGCQTIYCPLSTDQRSKLGKPYYNDPNDDYNDYIKLFDQDNGQFIISRYVTLPNV